MQLGRKYSFEVAKAKVQKICAFQEKCIFEITQKLKSWQIPNQEIEKIIDDLIDKKFIDEDRYTQAFVNSKLSINQWGKIRLRFELKQRKIESSIIEKYLLAINETKYLEILRHLLQYKVDQLKNKDFSEYELKSKLVNYLQGKGFEMDLIFKEVGLNH
jgi:regulatory protein